MLNKELEHFRNLISLAVADGKIEEIERITLSKMAFERGIPLDRLNVMLEHAHEYTYLIPQNQKEREKQLEDMVRFAMVDGNFANAERELIITVGEKLGYSKEQVSGVIENHSRANP